ncbi:hypothetical protein FRC14_002765 [Serendipita sp. 396]|nr:hypothetical protein FRC14_002765 [Serendipita sp. 396]KAG8789691.1 hypothetical protein FRC15_003760 [Serendipita sp. 397]KAG8803987.1 hypothetical protein FRC16_001704 [Serendipita sp. 398]KAG8846040.1 hypothetical protein FRB91_001220 [Serendipita sp. 411]KAG8876306.1 hypothetical protein FRC20_001809 [Serendipita sp. 405]
MVSLARRLRATAKGLIAVCTLIILVLSSHINLFMGFFYIADRLPFVLSILTAAVISVTSILERVKGPNVATAKNSVEVGILSLFVITWTAANAFSTPRWNNIQPGVCSAISIESNPAFQSGVRVWCRELLVLRAFVWIQWLILAVSLVLLVSFCIRHSKHGASHVWSSTLANYDPQDTSSNRWNAKSRVFSHLSWGITRDRNEYAFDMQTPEQLYQQQQPQPQQRQREEQQAERRRQVQETFDQRGGMNTLRSIQSDDSGPALVGYQFDPFNVPKERPISMASSGEGAVQPLNWRNFAKHGFDQSAQSTSTNAAKPYQHAYSTSIDHHPGHGYAM